MGRYRLDVRANDAAVTAALRQALAAYDVGTEPDAPPNVSIVLTGSDSGGRVRRLNLLYWAHVNVVRSRDPRRVINGLLHVLAFRGRPLPDDQLQVQGL